MAEKWIVVRLDGEVWECAPGEGDDENTISVVPISQQASRMTQVDVNAKAKGITHRQSRYGYGAVLCHEIRKLDI